MLFLGKPIVFFTLQVYHLLIGLMLALPRLISARRRPGNWKFDWVVFIAVCVPALYVTLTPWAPTFLWSYWPFFNLISSTGTLVRYLAAVIFAFFFVTSWRKVDPC
jgi:hypothetical protein